MKFTTGKRFRGCGISEIPSWYLRWVLEYLDLRPHLRLAVEDELAARAGEDDRTTRGDSRYLNVMVAREIITAGRRSLALRHHPDHGGNVERMKLINTTADVLLERVGALC
jgi:hypothetical protein